MKKQAVFFMLLCMTVVSAMAQDAKMNAFIDALMKK